MREAPYSCIVSIGFATPIGSFHTERPFRPGGSFCPALMTSARYNGPKPN